jgi:hypothetical protein
MPVQVHVESKNKQADQQRGQAPLANLPADQHDLFLAQVRRCLHVPDTEPLSAKSGLPFEFYSKGNGLIIRYVHDVASLGHGPVALRLEKKTLLGQDWLALQGSPAGTDTIQGIKYCTAAEEEAMGRKRVRREEHNLPLNPALVSNTSLSITLHRPSTYPARNRPFVCKICTGIENEGMRNEDVPFFRLSAFQNGVRVASSLPLLVMNDKRTKEDGTSRTLTAACDSFLR